MWSQLFMFTLQKLGCRIEKIWESSWRVGLWWHLPDASLLALLALWYLLQAFVVSTALFRDFV